MLIHIQVGLGEDIYDKKEIAGQKDGLKDENSDSKLGENKPKLEGKSVRESSEPIISAIGQKRTVGQNKNK